MNSIKALEELVHRAEAVVTRLQAVDGQRGAARLPDPPVPLTLDAAEEWTTIAEEHCRKPRIAESKRLLKEKGLDAAAIPAHVLSSPEAVAEIIKRVTEYPPEFHAAAFGAVGAALTKGFEDAEAVISTYGTAVERLRLIEGLRAGRDWVYRLAIRETAASPGGAEEIVERAEEVGNLSELPEKYGIQLREFASLADALSVLGELSKAARGYENTLLEEGLTEEPNPVAGVTVEEAAHRMTQVVAALHSEKTRLRGEASALGRELSLIGRQASVLGSTISELRLEVQELGKALADRRRELQSSLGEPVYQVVQAIAAGDVPSRDVVSDGELGAAIRKAVESGYRLHLEAPHEDQ